MQVVSERVTVILTPMSTVLLEKLIGSQLIQKLPAFYGIQRFITAFTTARHLTVLPIFMKCIIIIYLPVWYMHSCRCISRQLASRERVTATAKRTPRDFC